MQRIPLYGLVFLMLAVFTSGCVVHRHPYGHSHKQSRAKKCKGDKVPVLHKGKWKCKKRKHAHKHH